MNSTLALCLSFVSACAWLALIAPTADESEFFGWGELLQNSVHGTCAKAGLACSDFINRQRHPGGTMNCLSALKYSRHFALLASMFTVHLSAHAQDASRIEQLEREIQAIKLRLSKLESPQGNAINDQKPGPASEGWKSITSWRQLKTGMSPNEVRAILGEPVRLDGGQLAYWHYANRGSAVFYLDKLDRWTEPK